MSFRFSLGKNNVVIPSLKDFNLLDISISKMNVGQFAEKLYIRSHEIFMKINKVKNLENSIYYEQILGFCSQYRNILIDIIEANEKVNDSNLKELAYLSSHLCLWHLAEIVFFKQTREIVFDLMEWLLCQYSQLLEKKLHDVQCLGNPSEHEDYWNTVFLLVFQGQTNEASFLLTLHSEYVQSDKCPFFVMKNLLSSYPNLSVYYNSLSINEYQKKVNSWNLNLNSINFNLFLKNEQLMDLFKILSGDVNTFVKNKYSFQSWLHMLIPWVFYNKPLATFDFVVKNTETFRKYFSIGHIDDSTSIDKMIYSIFKSDLGLFIRTVNENVHDWWFLCHFTDIASRLNLLNYLEIPGEITLREKFSLNHASYMMNSNRFLYISMEYLATCPNFGRSYMELLLPRVEIKTAKDARFILNICNNFKLSSVANFIQSFMAKRCLNQKLFSSAFFWALETKNCLLIGDVVKNIVDSYPLIEDNVISFCSNSVIFPEIIAIDLELIIRNLIKENLYTNAFKLLLNSLNEWRFKLKTTLNLFSALKPVLESKDVDFNSDLINMIPAFLDKLIWINSSIFSNELEDTDKNLVFDFQKFFIMKLTTVE